MDYRLSSLITVTLYISFEFFMLHEMNTTKFFNIKKLQGDVIVSTATLPYFIYSPGLPENDRPSQDELLLSRISILIEFT